MLLKPSEIRYSQDKIRATFKDRCQHGGTPIGKTLDDLCEGRCDISQIPRISVKWMDNKGYWVTADNRRLWVFKHLERLGKCTKIEVDITRWIDPRKFSSLNNGKSIEVRGFSPGGTWYRQPAPRTNLDHDTTAHEGYLSNSRTEHSDPEFGLSGVRRSVQARPSSFTVPSSGLLPAASLEYGEHGGEFASRFGSMSISQETTKPASRTKSHLLVAAIDFGTTYSGYAYSFRNQFEADPLKVMTNKWETDSNVGVSLKTPTCILFDPQQHFHSFGSDAEDEYARLAAKGKHSYWYFFKRFKMILYDNQNLSRHSNIRDVNGRQMSAMTVFSESIKFLKRHFLESLFTPGYASAEIDTHWVLTVPAIWNDSAKQFMREAAEKAGIDAERLKLSLEPEAASVFCKHLPSNTIQDGETSCFKPGTRYLVLDAGGGTVDITVHETRGDHTIKELYKANGGPWGGTKVDEAFIAFLTEISSAETLEQFKRNHMTDYLDLMRDFEIKKAATLTDSDQTITFKMPVSFQETYAMIHKCALSESNIPIASLRQKISIRGDKLRTQSEVVRGFFMPTCEKIIDHLRDVFSQHEVRNTDTIIMVGGFSESKMLQYAVRRNFPFKKVIIPPEAGLAVLKGAVIFGHNPKVVASRVARVTYGVATSQAFDPLEHPIHRQFEAEGKLYCRDVFDVHVNAGDEVREGVSFTEKTYFPVYSTSKELCIKVYTSDKKAPSFIDELGCKKLGSIDVDFGDLELKSDKAFKVSMKYGGTELHVEAHVVKTGQRLKAQFEFL